jgi:hypothetical protein
LYNFRIPTGYRTISDIYIYGISKIKEDYKKNLEIFNSSEEKYSLNKLIYDIENTNFYWVTNKEDLEFLKFLNLSVNIEKIKKIVFNFKIFFQNDIVSFNNKMDLPKRVFSPFEKININIYKKSKHVFLFQEKIYAIHILYLLKKGKNIYSYFNAHDYNKNDVILMKNKKLIDPLHDSFAIGRYLIILLTEMSNIFIKDRPLFNQFLNENKITTGVDVDKDQYLKITSENFLLSYFDFLVNEKIELKNNVMFNKFKKYLIEICKFLKKFDDFVWNIDEEYKNTIDEIALIIDKIIIFISNFSIFTKTSPHYLFFMLKLIQNLFCFKYYGNFNLSIVEMANKKMKMIIQNHNCEGANFNKDIKLKSITQKKNIKNDASYQNLLNLLFLFNKYHNSVNFFKRIPRRFNLNKNEKESKDIKYKNLYIYDEDKNLVYSENFLNYKKKIENYLLIDLK